MLFRRKTSIVATLTTTPARIGRIRPALESLFNQSLPFDRIYLNVPYFCVRTGEKYELPSWLSNERRIILNRCPDFGPATKLLGAKPFEQDQHTVFIYMDDDEALRDDLVEQYMHFHHRFRRDVLGLSTCVWDAENNTLAECWRQGDQATIVEGYGSALVPAQCIGSDIFEQFLRLPPPFCYADDLFFSNYFLSRHVKIRNIASEQFNRFNFAAGFQGSNTTTDYWNDATALQNQSATGAGNLELYRRARECGLFPHVFNRAR
jgi:hypothetical protein